MDLPEKKVVTGARHWRTLLQICHDFQGASGEEFNWEFSMHGFNKVDFT